MIFEGTKVLVCGVPHGGTSLATKYLIACGMESGLSESSLAAGTDPAQGWNRYENPRFVSPIGRRIGWQDLPDGCWDDGLAAEIETAVRVQERRFPDAMVHGWKCGRALACMPMLLAMFQDLRIVIVTRDFRSNVRALVDYRGLSWVRAAAVVDSYRRHMERYEMSPEYNTLTVRFEDLIDARPWSPFDTITVRPGQTFLSECKISLAALQVETMWTAFLGQPIIYGPDIVAKCLEPARVHHNTEGVYNAPNPHQEFAPEPSPAGEPAP